MAFLLFGLAMTACSRPSPKVEGPPPVIEVEQPDELVNVGGAEPVLKSPGELQPAAQFLNQVPISFEVNRAPVAPKVIASVVMLPAPSMNAEQLREVKLSLSLTAEEAGALKVEFVAPDGAVFDRREANFEANVLVPQTLEFSLPIAGTWVHTQAMTGVWTARALFNGETVAASTFEVTP